MDGESEAYSGGKGEGRFLRIESKLDKLIDVSANRHTEVTNRLTAIETKARTANVVASDIDATTLAQGNLRWLKIGVFASFVVALLSVVAVMVVH